MMVPHEIPQLLPLMELVKLFVSATTSGGDALGRDFSLNTPATMVGGGKGKAFSPNTSTMNSSLVDLYSLQSDHR